MDSYYKTIKNKFIFDFETNNGQNKRNIKLSIMKNGKIYWLRKLFIIFQNKSIIFNRNRKLYFYFYYPIKDIDMTKDKSILTESNETKRKDYIFCNNLEDIKTAVKDFLNIKKKSLLKINLYNENFNILKSDIQLMKKHDKYKIIYAKVIELSNISINLLNNIHSSNKNAYNLFESKIIKNSFSSDFKFLDNPTKIYLRNIKISNKIEKEKEKTKTIDVHKNINIDNKNTNRFNTITNSIDTLILDDMEGVYSIDKNNNKYLNSLLNNNNKRFNNDFTRISKSYKIPIIKSKGILNSQMYKIFNTLNSKKPNTLRHKLSLDVSNSNYESNAFVQSKLNNFKSYANIRNNNFRIRNDIFNPYNINLEKMSIFKGFKKSNYYITGNINNNNFYSGDIFENIKCNQFTSKFEVYQILFIALNDIIKDFISDKLDNYISDEEIITLFDIENMIISITNLDVDMSINIYLKEFLLYLFISNYINLYHSDFCFYLQKIIEKDDYIKINNILSINSFKRLIYDVKSMFQTLTSNKNIFKEKIKENYDKNEKIISIPTFILCLFYNRKNLLTEFYKDIIVDSFNAIDILIDINNINDGLDVNQYIKFRLYLTKNHLINDSMKKEFISNFFNKTVYKNKKFDKTRFIIEVRPIFNSLDSIINIINNKDLNPSLVNEIYNKFIDYFNF